MQSPSDLSALEQGYFRILIHISPLILHLWNLPHQLAGGDAGILLAIF